MKLRSVILAFSLLVSTSAWPQTTPQPMLPTPDQKAAPAAQGDVKPSPEPDRNPNKQCVSNDDFNIELRSNYRPVGETLVVGTSFLPTGQPVDIGIRTSYVDGLRYFAAVRHDDGYRRVLARQDVVTRRAVASDSLVKDRLLEADQTIVTLELETRDAGVWQMADLYLYTCAGSPSRISQINIRLSPYRYSLWVTGLTILVLYLLMAWFLRKHDGTFQS